MMRVFLAIVFSLGNSLILFADPPASPPSDKAARFATLFKERSDWQNELDEPDRRSTADAAKNSEIEKKRKEIEDKLKEIDVKLALAAESAFAEAPNVDRKVTSVLVNELTNRLHRDDYEKAFALGKTLMNHQCSDELVPAMAGIAAFCVNDFDRAEPWLQTAAESGSLTTVCKLQKLGHFENLPEQLMEAKTAWEKEKKIRDAEAKANDLPRVLLKTSAGEIEVELFENEAPNSVLNFITLVDKKFYDGLRFHRVLPAFMAQGGDPKGDGSGGPGYTIPGEFDRPDHRLHFRGCLSMARASEPDSGGSQFFLTFVPLSHLDGKYTVFGRVVRGMDVLAKIKRRNPSDATDDPTDKAKVDRIIEAKVIRRRPHPYDAKDLKKSAKPEG